MKTQERFDNAINKLYNSFHNGTLNPECAKQCAVGNICGNTDSWRHLTDIHGSLVLNYTGIVNENFGRKFYGYKPSELLQIEAAFLRGCGYSLPYTHTSIKPADATNKENLFDGLCEVVALLCKLEGIHDIMNYSNLFDFEPNTSREVLENQVISLSYAENHRG